LCHTTYAHWVSISSGKTKVRYFDRPAVVHKKITGLEISMEDPIGMAVGHSGEELKHERFDF